MALSSENPPPNTTPNAHHHTPATTGRRDAADLYRDSDELLQLSLAFPAQQPTISPTVFTLPTPQPPSIQLYPAAPSPPPPLVQPPPPPPPLEEREPEQPPPATRPPRRQHNRNKSPSLAKNLPKGKTATIPPPYRWATDHRCRLHPLEHLKANGVTEISGKVKCKKCERHYEMTFNLESKFREVGSYICENKEKLRQRAPEVWNNPALPDCQYCDQKNAVKPELGGKKKNINWLFLFLGQMLGCCKLTQLRYFCKHTYNHRTGAKDRVLYLAYIEIFKQLYPYQN